MTACSSCGASHAFGVRRHTPACPSYMPRDLLFEHPDLRDLDSNVSYWYPALAVLPVPGRALLRSRRGR